MKIIRLILSIILLTPYAYFQANYWHLEYKFWYIYLILAVIPWIDYIFTNRDDLKISMKAWKKVGFFLGLIGFLIIKNLISLAIDVILAAILFRVLFSAVTWKKGAILGGLWGLISIFASYLFALGTYFGEFGNPYPPPLNPWDILFLPGFVMMRISFWLDINNINTPWQDFLLFLPIILGALIGSIIGFSIEKHKQKGVT